MAAGTDDDERETRMQRRKKDEGAETAEEKTLRVGGKGQRCGRQLDSKADDEKCSDEWNVKRQDRRKKVRFTNSEDQDACLSTRRSI